MKPLFVALNEIDDAKQNLKSVIAIELMPTMDKMADELAYFIKWWKERRYYRQSAWLLTACIVLLSLT